MKKLIPFIAACLLLTTAAATDSSAPSVLQIRLVQEKPSNDSEPMPLVTRNTDGCFTNVLNIEKTVLLDQMAVKSARAVKDGLGQPVVAISLTGAGARQFADVTRHNLDRRLAIIIAGQLVEAPAIRMEIADGQAQISGRFTKQEAQDLARKISAALPEK